MRGVLLGPPKPVQDQPEGKYTEGGKANGYTHKVENKTRRRITQRVGNTIEQQRGGELAEGRLVIAHPHSFRRENQAYHLMICHP